MHECPRCHKTFERERFFMEHLARKNPCTPEEPLLYIFTCNKCPKKFKHQSSACRHRATCSGPRKSLAQQLVEARQQIAELTEAPRASYVTNVDNRVTHVTDNSVTTVIQVNINGYGSERQEYLESLTYSQLKKILKLSPDNESLLNMIKFIHRNKDHPENVNIKLDSKDSETINVFRNKAWKEEKTEPTIYDLICRSRVRFIDVEPQLTSGMTKTKLESLNDYLDKVEDMSNSEDATMYSNEYAFMDLISKVKDVLVHSA